MVFTIIKKRDWSSINSELFVTFYGNQDYLKMRVKKVNIFKDIKLEIFNSIETFFSIYKNLKFYLCPNVARFFKNSFIWKD